MTAWNAIRSLGPIDWQSVRRDSLLRWMLFIPFVIAGVLRWFLPWLAGLILARFNFDVTPYFSLMMGLVVQVIPLMFGMVIGFLLLDQRDDGTLRALQVTPLTLTGYLIYRITMPTLLSFLMTLVVIPLCGLVTLDLAALALVALASSLLAPIFALFLAAFAQNKVQGFALQKAAGVVMVPPLAAYFIHSPWQLLCGLVPTYWPARLYWALEAHESTAVFYVIGGIVCQWVVLMLLIQRFNKVMVAAD